MHRLIDLAVAWLLFRSLQPAAAEASDIDPLERLKLAREREKMERDERRALEQRATTMLSVTVALAALGLAGLRQLVETDQGGDPVLAWVAGPVLYAFVTVVLLLRALTVAPLPPADSPVGESAEARLARAEQRSRAISSSNLKVVERVRDATAAFSIGFLLLLSYATFVALSDGP